MSLSTSRQQFLAYESHNEENIQYGRKGGIFISTCICISFIIFAVLIAAIVGIIVFYITYFKISQKSTDFWDDTEPFAQTGSPSPDLRLPPYVVPSFYRLKIKANLERSTFGGDVYITIKATRKVQEIILHSKNLNITNTTLTEQIYEKVETIQAKRVKREINNTIQESANFTDQSVTDNNVIEIESTTFVPFEITTNSLETTTASLETQVSHSNVRNIKIKSMSFSTGERLILSLGSPLTPNVDYTLQISFSGEISNALTGFYKSSYTENNTVSHLAVTQFEPTSARAAFPCFDEPMFKAKFEISIAHRQNVSVLSNMKVAAEEPIESEPGWQWTHFDRSVKMSTYLVAYVLSDFKSIETSYLSKDNVTKPIRIWTRPSLISKAKYALSITPKILAFYEEVFGLPYALDKIDLIAIPDFSSGAMENWGLITFRETALIYDEKNGVPREKQNVAIDIAHELAHQWFGNLVTMKWWTDLWLNEGFATYIEYVGVNYVTPEWDMLDEFVQVKMDLLRTDALKNISPVSRQVIDASEIAQKFDEISYSKSASLIRMLNHTISSRLFHEGLLIYLNKWKYQNAEENDLWQAMSEATKTDPKLKDLSVEDFMNTWTRQPGYPVVNVYRNYSTGIVTFKQKIFQSTKNTNKNTMDQIWRIPISYATLDVPIENRSTAPKLWLNDRTLNTNIPLNDTDALYINVDAIGYYRVNYDQRNWELLSKAMKAGAISSPVIKAQLIDDAFNLAKSGQLDYSYALGLTTCVINGENSKMVWDMLLNNMAFLHQNLKSTSGYVYFQDYMRIILKKQLENLNYGLKAPKDDNESFIIENLVMWECWVESPRCLKWVRDQFDKWIEKADLDDNSIPTHLRSLVYNMAIKHGGRKEFEFFWNMFNNSTDPNVKSMIISLLPSVKSEALITLLLEKSLGELPSQYAHAVWNVDPPIGTRVAQDFIIDNFDRVYETFNDMDSFMFPLVLNGAFGFIKDSRELDKLKSFAIKHKEELMPMSQTLQKIVDTAVLRINWIKEYSVGISGWFKEYVTTDKNPQTTTTPEVPTTEIENTTISLTQNATISSL